MDLICFSVLCSFFPLCASVYLCILVTCWESVNILALLDCGVYVSLSLSHWYPGSGVVLDCIDY